MNENNELELCKYHRQETNQSHFDNHNCDFCKLEKEVERLRGLLPPTAHGLRNGPGEGTWSVYAGKLTEERDAAIAEVERLRAMLVNLAVPLEGFLSDIGTHKYVAPTVLAAMQEALQHTRKQMKGDCL